MRKVTNKNIPIMKRFILSTLLCFALFGVAKAEIVEIIGDGGTTTNESLPVNTYYSYNLTEQIYTAEEIGMAGTISSIAFYNGGSTKSPEIKIYLVNTDQSMFSSEESWLNVSADDLVYEGTVTFTAGGWTTIVFDNTFAYDGTSNLGLIVDEHLQWSSTGINCRVFSSTNNCSIYVRDDRTDYDAVGANYTATNRLGVKNQIKLDISSGVVCAKPAITVSGITNNEATLTVSGGSGTYNVQYKAASATDWIDVATNTTNTTFTLNGLTQLTAYDVQVQSVCDGGATIGWRTLNFSTTASIETVGDAWSDDFEGTFCGWGLVNGNRTNAWVWGTATNNGGTRALYISNDNGTTNAYTVNGSAAMVYATKLLSFTEGHFEFSYDWMAIGESDCDFLRVVLVPASETLTAGTTPPAGLSASDTPSTWIAVDGGSKLNMANTWQNKTVAVNVPTGNYYLVLAWRNDANGGGQSPAAVDNVSITHMACPTPTDLVATPDNYNATLNWTGASDSYIVSYRTASHTVNAIERFNESSIPTGWTMGTGYVNGLVNGTATLEGSTSRWHTASDVIGAYHMKLDVYGENCTEWLVTPEIKLGGDLSFDLAITGSNGDMPNIEWQADDRFIVLIYADDAWTILREWNNSGSPYVYNGVILDIDENGDDVGQHINIDLTDYYGKNVKFAFYGESTLDYNIPYYSDASVHLDNVSWTVAEDAGEWQTVTVDNTTAILTSLTPETVYDAKVQGNCGINDLSLESSMISFTTLEACPIPTNVTVSNITHNSATVAWTGYCDSYILTWIRGDIYPISTIVFEDENIPAEMTNDAIYPWVVTDAIVPGNYCIRSGNSGISSSTSTITITMTYSVAGFIDFDAVCRGEGTSTYYDHCDFYIDSERVLYAGGNLTDAGWLHYKFPVDPGEHTFSWSYSKDSSINPNGDYFAVDNIKMYTEGVMVQTPITTNNTTYFLDNLNPETYYYVGVQGVCGTEQTEASAMVDFLTDVACHAPTSLVATPGYDAMLLLNGTLGDYNATLNWNGASDSYIVSYRTASHTVNAIERFNESSIPTGWTMGTGYVNGLVNGTATLEGSTSRWHTASDVIGAYHMKLDVYGENCTEWLVTPEIKLGGDLSFDLAITGSNGDMPNIEWQADDRFIVLIYADDAWTILREWNNSGSPYVYNGVILDIDENGDDVGQHINIDLTDYYGKNVKFAFYGESTLDYNIPYYSDASVHLDNVSWTVAEDAGEWQTVTADNTTTTLTSLTPETVYDAKVQGDCGVDGLSLESSVIHFTTLAPPPTVTQTIDLASGSNWVSFNVDITLDNLKAALVTALSGTQIVIKAKGNMQLTYTGSKWKGNLTSLDVAQMYMIQVAAASTISVEGLPVVPAGHPVTIVPGANWIAFPFNTSMTPTEAFAGFALTGDVIKNKDNQSAAYNGTKWKGSLTTLEPGKGYVFTSSQTNDRFFVFPTAK